MNKKQMKKKVTRQMGFRFGIAALICVGVIAVFSALVLWMYQRMSIAADKTLDDQAVVLIEKIDDILIKGNTLSDLEAIRTSYERLSEEAQRQVTDARYQKVLEAITVDEALRESGNQLVVEDKSQNGFDMDFASAEGALLKNCGGRIAFEGKADVAGENAEETFNRLINGTGNFTIEAEINPNGWGYTDADYNMIVSKGDNSAAFRISGQNLYFFIKNTDGDWMGVMRKLSEEQMDSWIHVAAIYDGNNISVYLEGSRLKVCENVGAVAASEYPFGIGYCPETQRISTVSIRSLRVYAQALTKEELDEGVYSPEDKNVVLWYDFDEYSSSKLDTEPTGMRVFTDSVEVLAGDTAKIQAEPTPYYAQGDLVYHIDREEVAAVSADGTVTGIKDGTAVVTVKMDGTDYSAEIPVTVGDTTPKLYILLEWLRDRIVLIDVTAAVAALIIILFIQRRQLISYLSELSGAVSLIGENAKEVGLPPILKEMQDTIRGVEESFWQKEHRAREAEKRKNDLVVYLAHDLKTPIASMIGYLTLLRDEEQITPELHQHYVEIIMNNAERLDDLINEFFDITRFNITQITLAYREINLTFLLEQMSAEFRPMLAEKGLTCILDVPKDVRLRCDGDKLERVFDNLLRNAISYSFPDTEIRIRVATGDDVVLYFTNYGETIPQEKLGRIFEQFYRMDSSRASNTGGSGLGLAIAKQIVELHHGEIKAESRNNMICFTVRIPFSENIGEKYRENDGV